MRPFSHKALMHEKIKLKTYKFTLSPLCHQLQINLVNKVKSLPCVEIHPNESLGPNSLYICRNQPHLLFLLSGLGKLSIKRSVVYFILLTTVIMLWLTRHKSINSQAIPCNNTLKYSLGYASSFIFKNPKR